MSDDNREGSNTLPAAYAPDDLPPGYEDTTRYRRLHNGPIYDMQVHHIVANPGGGLDKISPTHNPKAIYAERVLAAKIAAQEAVEELAKASQSKKTFAAGWREIVKAQAGLALDVDRGRASTDAARFVGQATGFLGDSRRDDDTTNAAVGAVATLAGVLSQYMSANIAGSQSSRVIIDGDIVEDSPDL